MFANVTTDSLRQRLRVLAAITFGAWLTGGCGKEPAPDQMAEVRGEPINALSNRLETAPMTSAASPIGTTIGSNGFSPAASTPAVESQPDQYQGVGFDQLSSFRFEISDEILGPVTNDLSNISAKTESLIPSVVKALDKKRVELKGFMLPLRVEGGLVTEMLIMKDQSMCCYGVVPKINEWVSVKMVSKGVRPVMDEAVTLSGTLHVGEMRENGYLVGIYRMDGERMASAVE